MHTRIIHAILIATILAPGIAAHGKGQEPHHDQDTSQQWRIILGVHDLDDLPPETVDLAKAARQEGITIEIHQYAATDSRLTHVHPELLPLLRPGHPITQDSPDRASDEDCRWLILALTEDFPYVDAAIRIECLVEEVEDLLANRES